jgi:hypothetical protein
MPAPKGNQFAKRNRGGPGRTPIYSTKLLPIVKGMCEDGATDYEIAERLGISKETLRSWRFRYEEFRNAMTLGRQGMLERVKSAYFSRAVGYTYKSEKVQILANGTVVRTPIVEHVPPDTGAAWNLMKNLEPNAWRDKNETKVEGSFNWAELVNLSMKQREAKAEAAKLIEAQANQAENEE